MDILLAIIVGLLFGFVLQKSGAANPQLIIDMLRLKNFHLMKAILTGIGISSLLLFLLMSVGIFDISHISIKTAYIGVIIGGGILGIGWAISGFCPGTGVVAAGANRKDALFFILGGLAGAFVYTLIFSSINSGFMFEKLGGGKATLANTGIEKYISLIPTVSPLIVAGSIGIILLIVARLLPEKK